MKGGFCFWRPYRGFLWELKPQAAAPPYCLLSADGARVNKPAPGSLTEGSKALKNKLWMGQEAESNLQQNLLHVFVHGFFSKRDTWGSSPRSDWWFLGAAHSLWYWYINTPAPLLFLQESLGVYPVVTQKSVETKLPTVPTCSITNSTLVLFLSLTCFVTI